MKKKILICAFAVLSAFNIGVCMDTKKAEAGINIDVHSLQNDLKTSADSKSYKVIDGVTFSKDGKKLISYPASKKGAYEVPEGVIDIYPNAFKNCENLTELKLNDDLEIFYLDDLSGCVNLEKLTLPENLKTFYIENGSIVVDGGRLFNLKEVNISDKNAYYASYEGALYTKDYKKMCIMPAGREKLTIHENA